ncbi:MAG: hypothetical protein KAR36_12855, partial [Candidatus Latescibacteria bacterium]|nr:hypothetical protein [Candidatus Latescibacterota bacterium]
MEPIQKPPQVKSHLWNPAFGLRPDETLKGKFLILESLAEGLSNDPLSKRVQNGFCHEGCALV